MENTLAAATRVGESVPDPGTAFKKKRGRPRKEVFSSPLQEATNGMVYGPKPKRIRRKKSEIFRPASVTDTFIGQPVHGVLDGCFDAGYILTVRVGDTDTVLRGVVFGPGLSVPITKSTDVAPNVRFAMRDESISGQMNLHQTPAPEIPHPMVSPEVEPHPSAPEIPDPVISPEAQAETYDQVEPQVASEHASPPTVVEGSNVAMEVEEAKEPEPADGIPLPEKNSQESQVHYSDSQVHEHPSLQGVQVPADGDTGTSLN